MKEASTPGERIAALHTAVEGLLGTPVTTLELASRVGIARETVSKWKNGQNQINYMGTRRDIAGAFCIEPQMCSAYVDGELPLDQVAPISAAGIAEARRRGPPVTQVQPRPTLFKLLNEPEMADRWPLHAVSLAKDLLIADDLTRQQWIAQLDRISEYLPMKLIENVLLVPRRRSRVQKIPKS